MKMLSATSVAALALGLALSGTAAHAADYPGRNNQDATTQQQNDNDKGDKKDRHAKPAAPAEATPAASQGAHDNNRNRARNAKLRHGYNEQTNDGLRPVNQNDWRANDNRRNQPNWNRNNRHNIDMRRWNRNYDSPRRFRAGAYYAPRGYSYRRWAYGQRLPRNYYARNFWLMDFVMFGLLTPPDGYVWVRYGPDALLIDEETGEIIQVRYNVFYS